MLHRRIPPCSLWLWLFCLLLMGQQQTHAQVIPYNGYINKTSIGTPTDYFTITFSLWNRDSSDTSSPVNKLWQTTFNRVPVTYQAASRYGKFSVNLDFDRNIDTFFYNGNTYAGSFAQNLWLEIKVGEETPLLRQRFNTILPLTDVNKLVYVANALYRIDTDKTLERAAQAFFIRQVFAANPNADVRVVHRILSQSQNRFDSLYRSFQPTPAYRFRMPAYEVTANMLGILASSPGVNTLDPPGLALTEPTLSMRLAREAAEFAQNTGGWLSNDELDYLETSNLLGRGRIAGVFQAYQSKQLEMLYDLARSDMRINVAVDLFFGAAFNASTFQSANQILQANKYFALSQNFAPIAALILPDGSLRANLTEIRTKIADFQARMAAVFTDSNAVFARITSAQTANYAGYFEGNEALRAANRAAVLAQQNLNLPLLAASSGFSYIAPYVIEADPKHENFLRARARLDCAAKAAAFAADVMEVGSVSTLLKGGAPAAKAVASGLEFAGSALDVMEAYGAFGKSNEEVIMDGINNISRQISDMQDQINSRFKIIDANITNLYNTMNTQFSDIRDRLYYLNQGINQVSEQVRQNQAALLGIQSSLDRLSSNIINFENESSRVNIKLDLLSIAFAASQSPHGNFTQNEFGNMFVRFYQYAIDRADDTNEVGPAPSTRLYGVLDVETELRSGLPEWKTNYIVEFARRHFGPSRAGLDLTDYATVRGFGNSNVTVNPQAWEMSAVGLLRLSILQPQWYTPLTAGHSPGRPLGFYGVKSRGDAIQKMVAAVTLQLNGATLEKSPLFDDLLKYYRFQAENLINVINALPNGGTVAEVRGQYDVNGNPVAGLYKDAISRLNGAVMLIQGFVGFGLSRSLESVDLLSSLLYSPITPVASDTQRLPDGDLVKALYFQVSPPADPKVTFNTIQTAKRNSLGLILTDILNGVYTETIGRPMAGEPLASVEVMLRRIDAFVQPRVSGRVQPDTGAFIPGDPVQLTFRYDLNSATGRYASSFTIPVFPDAGGNFSVNVPSNDYSLSIHASKCLNRVFPVNTTVDAVNLGAVTLRVGDISGDNRTNLTDMILLRNAYGTKPSSANWNPLADLNSDGIIDITDYNIVKDRQGERGAL